MILLGHLKRCHFGWLATDVVMIVSILPGFSDSDSLRGGRQVESELGMLDLLQTILAKDVRDESWVCQTFLTVWFSY